MIDLTRAHGGTLRSAVTQARILPGYQSDSDAVLYVAADQEPEALALPSAPKTIVLQPTTGQPAAIVDDLKMRLQELIAAQPDRIVDVASFRNEILSHAQSLAGARPHYLGTPRQVEPIVQADIDALSAALAGAEGSLRPADIGSRVRLVDPGFSTRHKPVKGGGEPGFISRLLQEAERRGMVRMEASFNPPLVTPLPTPGSPAKAPSDAISLGLSVQYRQCLDQRNLGPYHQCRLGTYDSIAQAVAQNRERDASQRLTVVNVVDYAVDIARHQLSQTLPSDPSHVIAGQSAAPVVSDPVPSAPQNSTEESQTNRFPWSRFRNFLLRLASVVRPFIDDEGREIPCGTLEGRNRVPTSLKEDWQLAMDGELVLTLLKSGLEVELHQSDELAGALYNSRQQPEMQKAEEVLWYLQRTERIVPVPDDDCSTVVYKLASLSNPT
ncbi:MAG: hypothetical protein LBK28_05905 [Propionibacteriaceae bacterium]|nr:hypothetical protein [Propionibacteriaceae bacterium]